MNVEETKKAIAVMQAFVDGKNILHAGGRTESPGWFWQNDPNRYEIEPNPPILYRIYRHVSTGIWGPTGIVYKNSPHPSHQSYLKQMEEEKNQGHIDWISDWIVLPPIEKA